MFLKQTKISYVRVFSRLSLAMTIPELESAQNDLKRVEIGDCVGEATLMQKWAMWMQPQ